MEAEVSKAIPNRELGFEGCLFSSYCIGGGSERVFCLSAALIYGFKDVFIIGGEKIER